MKVQIYVNRKMCLKGYSQNPLRKTPKNNTLQIINHVAANSGERNIPLQLKILKI